MKSGAELRSYRDIEAFLRAAQSALELDEARNSLLLGAALDIRERGIENIEELFSAVVLDEDGPVLTALVVPPRGLLLATVGDCSSGAPEILAGCLADAQVPVPGVLGPAGVTSDVAGRLAELRGGSTRIEKQDQIRSARSIVQLELPEGQLRRATLEDGDSVAEWSVAEGVGRRDPDEVRASARRLVERGDVYVWDDGQARAKAVRARPTRRTVSIDAVYTPPEWRGRGFGTALVASLSAQLLAEGYAECVLYVGVTNRAAARIYDRIGYRPIAESEFVSITQ